MSVDTGTLARLAPGFTGRLLQPADAEYDDARRIHNGLVDKHPAIIARCRGVADVRDAVKLARALELEASVRGGGHNVAGHAVIEGGSMRDALHAGIEQASTAMATSIVAAAANVNGSSCCVP